MNETTIKLEKERENSSADLEQTLVLFNQVAHEVPLLRPLPSEQERATILSANSGLEATIANISGLRGNPAELTQQLGIQSTAFNKLAEAVVNAASGAPKEDVHPGQARTLFDKIKQRIWKAKPERSQDLQNLERAEATLLQKLLGHMETIREWMKFMGEGKVNFRVALSKAAYIPLLAGPMIRGFGGWEAFHKVQQNWWLLRTSWVLMTDRWGSIARGKEGMAYLQDICMTSERSSFLVRAKMKTSESWERCSQSEQMARVVYSKICEFSLTEQMQKNFLLDDKTDTFTIGFWKEGRVYKLPLRLSEIQGSSANPSDAIACIRRAIDQILEKSAPETPELSLEASRSLKKKSSESRHLLDPREEVFLKSDLQVHLDTLYVDAEGKTRAWGDVGRDSRNNERIQNLFLTGGSMSIEAVRFFVGSNGEITAVETKVAHAKQQAIEAQARHLKALDAAVKLEFPLRSPAPFTFLQTLQGIEDDPAVKEYAQQAEKVLPVPPEWEVGISLSAEQFNEWNSRIARLQERGIKITLPDLVNKAVMAMSQKSEVHTVMSRFTEEAIRGVKRKEILVPYFDMLPPETIRAIREYTKKVREARQSGSPEPVIPSEIVEKLLEGQKLLLKNKDGARGDDNLIAFMAIMAGDIKLTQNAISEVSKSSALAGETVTAAVSGPRAGMVSYTENRRYIAGEAQVQALQTIASEKMGVIVGAILPAMNGAQELPPLEPSLRRVFSFLEARFQYPDISDLFIAELLPFCARERKKFIADKQMKREDALQNLGIALGNEIQSVIRRHTAALTTENVTTAHSDIYLQSGAGVYAVCSAGEGIRINSRTTPEMLQDYHSVNVTMPEAPLEYRSVAIWNAYAETLRILQIPEHAKMNLMNKVSAMYVEKEFGKKTFSEQLSAYEDIFVNVDSQFNRNVFRKMVFQQVETYLKQRLMEIPEYINSLLSCFEQAKTS